jgi:hypothetical protein
MGGGVLSIAGHAEKLPKRTKKEMAGMEAEA